MNNVIGEPTLEQVRQAFKEWRNLKTFRREKTPKYLWDLVRAIVHSYPRRQIEIALSITKEQLDREAPPSISGLSQSPEITNNPEFVELSIPELLMRQSAPAPCPVLTITRFDGSSWSVSDAQQDIISDSLRLFLQA